VQIADNATALGGASMGLLLVTAGWTGLRWGELAGLQRSNLHLDDGVLLVDRYVVGLHESGSRILLGPPKTNVSVRIVSLPAVALLAVSLLTTVLVPHEGGTHTLAFVGWLATTAFWLGILFVAAHLLQEVLRDSGK
jgi:integrase